MLSEIDGQAEEVVKDICRSYFRLREGLRNLTRYQIGMSGQVKESNEGRWYKKREVDKLLEEVGELTGDSKGS